MLKLLLPVVNWKPASFLGVARRVCDLQKGNAGVLPGPSVFHFPPMIHRRGFVIALFLVIIASFALRNLPWHLDDYDQAKQAFTSYEMVREDHWLFQHTPVGRVATKPPFAGWISASVNAATGFSCWDIGWRLPNFLCAVALLIAIWKVGCRLMGGKLGGVVAVAAFGLNLVTPRLATLVRTDIMLSAFIGFIGLVVLKHVGGKPWSKKDGWIIFLLVLGSMMTKGPIAYAFLLPGMAAFWWFTRRGMGLQPVSQESAISAKSPHWPGASGWFYWFAPLLVFGGWAAIGLINSKEFYDQVFLKEFVGRFTVGENAVHHNHSPGYYSLVLLGRMAPWPLLIIGLFCVRQVRAAIRKDPALLWLVCWALGGLVFMELVPSKRFDRVFPIFIPLSLMIPAMARHLPDGKLGKWNFEKMATIACILAILGYGGFAVKEIVHGYQSHQGGLVEFGKRVRETVPAAERDQLALTMTRDPDEGMVIYTGLTDFTKPSKATQDWMAGKLNWLVIPKTIFEKEKAALPGAEILFSSGEIEDKNSEYLLIKRR